jgi:hypothetical protein
MAVHPRRYRRRPEGAVAQHRLEVCLDRERYVVGTKTQYRFNPRDLQPNQGSLREVRHDLQWSRTRPSTDELTWKVCGRRQWLVGGPIFTSACRLRQDDYEVSKHSAFPRRSLERPDTGPPASEEPRTLVGSE